jgi:hypothetical protein
VPGLKKGGALLSETEEDELIEFANAITPPNWIISREPTLKPKPGTLHVSVMFFYPYNGGQCSPMVFENRGAYTGIRISDDLPPDDLQHVILHELSHVASDRLMAFQKKIYRVDMATISHSMEDPEGQHGRLFIYSYTLMLNRAIRIYGETAMKKVSEKVDGAISNYEWDLDSADDSLDGKW